MARIRVALIGLSSKAKTSWAEEAHLAYLVSPRGSTHYEITALLNSSLESAAQAWSHFGLPDSVRLFDDPTALAADPDIDLVVCCTRTDVHFPTVQPSIDTGKRVFVEWPLASSVEHAAQMAAGPGSRQSIIGLQCRHFPVVKKLKAILNSGVIGNVLSSNVEAYVAIIQRDVVPQSLAYFTDRKIGGNPMTIQYGHMIDFVHTVLGEFDSFQSRMQIQRPDVIVQNEDGGSQRSSDVPDLLVVHGGLQGGARPVSQGATLAATFRLGPPFPGTSAFVWTINGEKGEIQINSPAGPYFQPLVPDAPISIKVHDYATDSVSGVEWDWEEWQKSLPILARNTADIYENYAAYVEGGLDTEVGELSEGERWPTLNDALVRMREVGEVFEQYDKQSP